MKRIILLVLGVVGVLMDDIKVKMVIKVILVGVIL